jgi:hypothetical protein
MALKAAGRNCEHRAALAPCVGDVPAPSMAVAAMVAVAAIAMSFIVRYRLQ